MINYYWQVGSLTVENLILQRKLMFWFHVKNLPEGSLVKEVLEKQEEKGLFCLTTELENDIKNLKIEDPCSQSKWQYKRRIKEYVKEKNRKDLLEESKKYKKVSHDEWKEEKFERKTYFSTLDLEGARMMFRLSGNMFPTRGNFPSKYRKDTLNCQFCKHLRDDTIVETQNHLCLTCPAFDDIRESLDLASSDQDMVTFFGVVTERQMKLENV